MARAQNPKHNDPVLCDTCVPEDGAADHRALARSADEPPKTVHAKVLFTSWGGGQTF